MNGFQGASQPKRTPDHLRYKLWKKRGFKTFWHSGLSSPHHHNRHKCHNFLVKTAFFFFSSELDTQIDSTGCSKRKKSKTCERTQLGWIVALPAYRHCVPPNFCYMFSSYLTCGDRGGEHRIKTQL